MLRQIALAFGVLVALVAVGSILSICRGPKEIPELLSGLEGDADTINRVFKQRVQERFPTPMSERALHRELAAHNFVVDYKLRSARFSVRADTCFKTWRIHWNRQDGQVSDLRATYRLVCWPGNERF